MKDHYRISLAIMLLVTAIAVRVATSPRLPRPPLIPIAEAEPWMAAALPGIGMKTREAMAAHIRAGERQKLPPGARAAALTMFSGWPEP